MTPANIAGLAKLAGAELIAVTDHNAADNLPAVQCCCNAYGLRLLPGVEVNTAEEIHVLCYFKTVDTALEFGRLLYAALPEFQHDPAVWGRQLVMDEKRRSAAHRGQTADGRGVDGYLRGKRPPARRLGALLCPRMWKKDSYALLSVLWFLPEDLPFAAVELHDASRLDGLVEKGLPRAGGAVLVGRAPHGGCGVQPACAGGGFCPAQAAVTWDLTPVPDGME